MEHRKHYTKFYQFKKGNWQKLAALHYPRVKANIRDTKLNLAM